MALRKGEIVSIESPINSDDKRFLRSFEDSSEERVLADRWLSKDQSALRSAINEGVDTTSIRTTLEAHWADPARLVRDTRNRFRWWHVARRGGTGGEAQKRPIGWPEVPPAWDHGSIWVRNAVPVIAVSQPYPWKLSKDIDQLNHFARAHGLSFRISNYPSSHYPGSCWFVEWYVIKA